MSPLSAAEAARHILDSVAPQPQLRVFLDDALNAVLAEDVASPLDIPPHTNSAMDGYAARSEDIRGASVDQPVRLEVIEKLPAGTFATKPVGEGKCARIFTGAALPEGADTVVRQEDTDEGDPVVEVRDDRDAGRNIRRAGEDIRKGTTVLTAGTALTAAHLGVLASMAHAHPLVFRAPRVGIMGGGDEIVDVDQPEEILSGRKIASSNSHTLRALVLEAGGEPVDLGLAADTPESLREHLGRATDCDLVVTSAGISVGEHDYVRQVLEELGGAIDFWRLRMRPGAPVGFGLLEATPWVGLPGNPVSAMVTFELFVRPAIRKMMGHRLPFRKGVIVRLEEPVKTSSGLQHFLRGIVTPTSEGLEARLTGPQGSGILTSMIHANALLIVPEGRNETPAGTQITALLFDDARHQAEAAFE
ncbi:MAG: gephyrin-like molybdotransferase Glp [Gemmatimonadales bacterium]